MNDVGEKIRIQRLTKKYSQEYMAFMLNISQAAYSKIERDETELTVQRVFDIAEILEISPCTFLPKPKYGSGINFTYFQTMAKLRIFWNKYMRKKSKESNVSFDSHRDTTNTLQK